MVHNPTENGPKVHTLGAENGGSHTENQDAFDRLVEEVNNIPIEVKKRIVKRPLRVAETR